MATVTEIGPRLGIAPTCAALGLPRATYYRRRRPPRAAPPRRPSPRALGAAERAAVLARAARAALRGPGAGARSTPPCSTRAGISAPSARCTASWPRTHEVRERRESAPASPSTRPRSCWPAGPTSSGAGTSPSCSGPAKWTYFYLYVMLDVFSRYVVGWMVAHRESATLAEQFIRETCARQGIGREQLTIHADRGSAMTSKPVALLLADLGVTKTHAPAARLQRQPVLRGAVQDAEVPPGVPGALRLDPGRPRPLPRLLPLVQHRAPSQRPRPADARTTCTTAWPSSASRRGRPCSPRPTRPTPSASPAGSPSRRRVPTEVWINRPKPERRV